MGSNFINHLEVTNEVKDPSPWFSGLWEKGPLIEVSYLPSEKGSRITWDLVAEITRHGTLAHDLTLISLDRHAKGELMDNRCPMSYLKELE